MLCPSGPSRNGTLGHTTNTKRRPTSARRKLPPLLGGSEVWWLAWYSRNLILVGTIVGVGSSIVHIEFEVFLLSQCAGGVDEFFLVGYTPCLGKVTTTHAQNSDWAL